VAVRINGCRRTVACPCCVDCGAVRLSRQCQRLPGEHGTRPIRQHLRSGCGPRMARAEIDGTTGVGADGAVGAEPQAVAATARTKTITASYQGTVAHRTQRVVQNFSGPRNCGSNDREVARNRDQDGPRRIRLITARLGEPHRLHVAPAGFRRAAVRRANRAGDAEHQRGDEPRGGSHAQSVRADSRWRRYGAPTFPARLAAALRTACHPRFRWAV
jgi:hypothetical protein